MLQTDDLRIKEIAPLISPAIIDYDLPSNKEVADLVTQSRQQAEAILSGDDDRLLVVVGPCSIHDPKSALEYGDWLKGMIDKFDKDLHIIMRVYFEKPRTTVGWKGLINDPNLNGSFDINKGLRVARELLIELGSRGISAGTEFLDTISPQYIADLIAWGAIGARTTESQIHRELASGLSMPVGFKNGTGGSTQIALDAIGAAANPHHFLSVTKQGVSAIVTTTGNTACHLILRGGKSGPNYSADDVADATSKLKANGLSTKLMIDCSHGNSLKDFKNQPKVAEELCQRMAKGDKDIAAVMVESNLVEGNQKLAGTLDEMVYGQSVTDACVSLETTEEMLAAFAQAVRDRRTA